MNGNCRAILTKACTQRENNRESETLNLHSEIGTSELFS